jgi:hypothetical protein
MDILMTQCNISSGRPLAGKVSPCYGFDQRIGLGIARALAAPAPRSFSTGREPEDIAAAQAQIVSESISGWNIPPPTCRSLTPSTR